MKKISLLLILCFSLFSCEDVIDVPLNTANPKLVIDASIKWQKGTTGNLQTIKLTTTTGFFAETIPSVNNAVVYVTNSANQQFDFVNTTNEGNYVCTNFVPVINENYTLTVVYNGETFTATEKLFATPTIEFIEQKSVEGFGGTEEIQVKFFYQDNGQEINYYLIGFKYQNVFFPEYGALKDEFFQGNQMFGFYSNPDLKTAENLDMSLQSISLPYFNYMSKLINISGSNAGSPFATPPATVKGNIINATNSANFALGYFNLSEIDTRNYVIE
jgi:hypothetical protein